jgi:lactate dehydrogenase-like 2-hydroxyacid dehydrogenase
LALYEMKIVIIGDFPDATKAAIRSNFPADWELAIVKPNMVRQEIHDADVIIPEHIRIDADFLSQAPRLKLVQTGAGYDNVDIDACRNKGVQVCNAAGVNANAVAEHVMAFILNWYKNITRLDNFMKSSAAATQLEYCGSELEGKTIGIIGF